MVAFAGDTVGEVSCVMMLIREGLQDRSGSLVMADHVR